MHECNIAGSNLGWWANGGGGNGTSTGATNAQWITFWKQIKAYAISLGLTNMLWCYNANNYGGGWLNNYPGKTSIANPYGADVMSYDWYGSTTQSGVISNFNNTSSGFLTMYNQAKSDGIPFLLSEFGPQSADNSTISLRTYDSSICDGRLQATFPYLIGSVCWNQNWALSLQLNAATYLSNCLTVDKVPAYI